jgi:TolB protein
MVRFSRMGRLVVVGLLFVLGSAHGRDITLVGKSGDGKLPFSLASVKVDATAESRKMVQILRQDLVRSGWFVETGEGAAIQISGKVSGGGALAMDVAARHTVNGKRYPSRTFTGKPDQAALVAHRSADALVSAITGHPGIAATRIVMVGNRGQGKDLYICHPDGSDMMQITQDRKPCLSPSWSPTADAVIYTSLLTGYSDVLRVDLGTAKRSVLVNYPGMNVGAEYAPDGRSLALTLSRDGNPELYVKDLKSGGLTRLTTTRLAAEASPSWSPDGKQIVYVSDKSRQPQLYTVARTGGRSSVLTVRRGESVSPDWGGAGIVYATKMEGRYGLCVIDPRTRREVWRYSEAGVDLENPSWAPDGRHIACVRTYRYRSQVYLLDTGGDAPLRLTDVQGDWHSPAWSSR